MLLQEHTIVMRHAIEPGLRQVLSGSTHSLAALAAGGWKPVIVFRPLEDGGWEITDPDGKPIRSRADLCERLDIMDQWTATKFSTGGQPSDADLDAAHRYATGRDEDANG